MTYTLWSHDELLGESDLDYVRVDTHLRAGDLRVTPRGLTLLDRLSQTHADGYYAMRRINLETLRGTFDPSHEETLFADRASEEDQYEALALELRAPNGVVIPTDSIYVSDTEFLLDIDSEREDDDECCGDPARDHALDPDDLAAVEEMRVAFEEDHPPWAQSGPVREPARFQLHVSLRDQWAIT